MGCYSLPAPDPQDKGPSFPAKSDSIYQSTCRKIQPDQQRNIYLLSLRFTCRETLEITTSMEQDRSCEGHSSPAKQHTLSPLCNLKVHYSVRNSLTFFHILRKINTVNTLLFHFSTSQFNIRILHLLVDLPRGRFLWFFPDPLCISVIRNGTRKHFPQQYEIGI